jgi:hypothetical protein
VRILKKNKAVMYENCTVKAEHAVHKEAGQLAVADAGDVASYRVFCLCLATVGLLVM